MVYIRRMKNVPIVKGKCEYWILSKENDNEIILGTIYFAGDVWHVHHIYHFGTLPNFPTLKEAREYAETKI